MQLPLGRSYWSHWSLEQQKFAIVVGKTKVVDVNPSLSAEFASSDQTAGDHTLT